MTKLVTGPTKFTTTARVSTASLSRGSVVYATGTALRRKSTLIVTLHSVRDQLKAGRYTLTLIDGHRHEHETVTIA